MTDQQHDSDDFMKDYLSFVNLKQRFTPEDDEIHFFLFPVDTAVDSSQERMQETCRDLLEFTNEITNNYIWQRERFQLTVVPPSSINNNETYLKGSVKYGENVDDEWLIVYLLFEMSKMLRDEWIIHTYDNDGQFLLIESSLHIPDWLQDNTPSNQNRVFIFNGSLHWLPDHPVNPAQIALQGNFNWFNCEYESIFKALQVFRMLVQSGKEYHLQSTIANSKVQLAIRRRIRSYPQKITTDIHYARVYLPLNLQYLLQENPQLISALVRSFVERNEQTMKPTFTMKRLLQGYDSASHLDYSFCIVKMTKCLYAQLMSQPFGAPRVLRSAFKVTNPTTDSRAVDLGLKLTCSFEMLYWENYTTAADSSESLFRQHDIQQKFANYLQSLETLNYFKNERKGSALYKQLEKSAKENFLSSISSSDVNQKRISSWIDKTLSEYSADLIVPLDRQEDSDAWMETGEGLDEFLDSKNDDDDQHNLTEEEQLQSRANNILSSLKAFVEHTSTHEGVEAPDLSKLSQREKKLEKLFSGLRFEDLADEDDFEETNDEYMREYMSAMDDQLKGFDEVNHMDSEDPDNDYKMLKNLLQSFKSQAGASGPFSNILREMGVDLPDDNDDDEDYNF